MSLSYGVRVRKVAYHMENEGDDERRRDGRRVARLNSREESEGHTTRYGESDCAGREAGERRRYIMPFLLDLNDRLVAAEIRDRKPLLNEEEFDELPTPCEGVGVADLVSADEAFYFPSSPSATCP